MSHMQPASMQVWYHHWDQKRSMHLSFLSSLETSGIVRRFIPSIVTTTFHLPLLSIFSSKVKKKSPHSPHVVITFTKVTNNVGYRCFMNPAFSQFTKVIPRVGMFHILPTCEKGKLQVYKP